MQSSLVFWSVGESNRRSPPLRTMTTGGPDIKCLPLTDSASPGHIALYFPRRQHAVLTVSCH